MPRKLRIAVSVFFGLLTVALCVLWVRSFWHIDALHFPTEATRIATSRSGWIQLSFTARDIQTGWEPGWGFRSVPMEEMASLLKSKPKWCWKSDQLSTLINFPFWVIVLASSLVSAYLCYLPQFSLRTLLVATTLVAVVLGLAVWAGR